MRHQTKVYLLAALACIFFIFLFTPPVFADNFGDGATAEVGDVNVEGYEDHSVYEAMDAERIPGTSAGLTVDSCSSGVSASAPGYGAAIAAGSRFCKFIALGNAYRVAGDAAGATWALAEAKKVLGREGRVTRFLHLDEIPLIGRLF